MLELGTGRFLLDCTGRLSIRALSEWLLALDHEDSLVVQAGHGVGRRRASLDARVERVRQKSLHEVLAESVMLRQRPQAEP